MGLFVKSTELKQTLTDELSNLWNLLDDFRQIYLTTDKNDDEEQISIGDSATVEILKEQIQLLFELAEQRLEKIEDHIAILTLNNNENTNIAATIVRMDDLEERMRSLELTVNGLEQFIDNL